jgi:hypothetical protein
MAKASFSTFTGKEFAQALATGTLNEAVVVTGMAKKADDPQVVLFAPGRTCTDWISIPVKMIEKVDWLGRAPCKDHTHDYVRLSLAQATSPEAKVLASLLARISDCGCGSLSQQAAPGTPFMQGFPGQSAGIPGSHRVMLAQARPPSALASFTLGPEHTLQFVEFAPGLTGTVEVGRMKVDVPAVGPELKNLSWLDRYRHFAGASAQVPQAILDAYARSPVPAGNLAMAPPESGASAGGSKGIHPFDDAEQAWFRNTFCNGAQVCVQAWDWATAPSDHSVNSGTGIAMVGSEGTVNATFFAYFWDCWCIGPFCAFGSGCAWFQFWQGVVVPGHWVSMDATNANNRYLRWDLTGAGGNTQVSVAARY